MPVDLKDFYERNRSYFGDKPLADVAKEAYQKSGAADTHSYDQWLDWTGVGRQQIEEDTYDRASQKARNEKIGLLAQGGRGLVRGVTQELPKTIGQGLQWLNPDKQGSKTLEDMGKSIEQFGESNKRRLPGFEPTNQTQDSYWHRAVSSAMESTPASLAPFGVGAIAGALSGGNPLVAMGAGAASMVPLFYAPAAEQKFREGEKEGLSYRDNLMNANIAGVSEIGTEMISDIIPVKVFGFLKAPAKGALLKGVTSAKPVKEVLKDMLSVGVAETSTEALNTGIQAASDKAFGINQDQNVGSDMLDAAGSAAVMSLVFGMVGIPYDIKHRRDIRKTLGDPKSSPKDMASAIGEVAGAAHAVDPKLGEMFADKAWKLYKQGKPVVFDDDSFYKSSGITSPNWSDQPNGNVTPPPPPSGPITRALHAGGISGQVVPAFPGVAEELPPGQGQRVPAGVDVLAGQTPTAPVDQEILQDVEKFKQDGNRIYLNGKYGGDISLVINEIAKEHEQDDILGIEHAPLSAEDIYKKAELKKSEREARRAEGFLEDQRKSEEIAQKEKELSSEPAPIRGLESTRDFNVDTEDKGKLGVRVNRLSDGTILVLHDNGVTEYKPGEHISKDKKVSDLSDQELLGYTFQALGYKSSEEKTPGITNNPTPPQEFQPIGPPSTAEQAAQVLAGNQTPAIDSAFAMQEQGVDSPYFPELDNGQGVPSDPKPKDIKELSLESLQSARAAFEARNRLDIIELIDAEIQEKTNKVPAHLRQIFGIMRDEANAGGIESLKHTGEGGQIGAVTAVGRASSHAEWFRDLNQEIKKNAPEIGGIDKKTFDNLLAKKETGQPLTDRQDTIWKAMQDAAEKYNREHPDTVQSLDDAELKKKGYEPNYGQPVALTNINIGDRLLFDGEEFEAKGFDADGNMVFKDGDIVKVDPFETVSPDGIKRAKEPMPAGIVKDEYKGASGIQGMVESRREGLRQETERMQANRGGARVAPSFVPAPIAGSESGLKAGSKPLETAVEDQAAEMPASTFAPAFKDGETGKVYPAVMASGKPSGTHSYEFLPEDVVTQRDANGEVAEVKSSLEPGFVKDGKFYTRDEAVEYRKKEAMRNGEERKGQGQAEALLNEKFTSPPGSEKAGAAPEPEVGFSIEVKKEQRVKNLQKEFETATTDTEKRNIQKSLDGAVESLAETRQLKEELKEGTVIVPSWFNVDEPKYSNDASDISYSDTATAPTEKLSGRVTVFRAKSEFKQLIDKVNAKGDISFNVGRDPSQITDGRLRKAVMKHEQETGKVVKAFFHKKSGTLYVFTDRVSSMKDLAGTVAHELVGHYGLYEFMGDELQPFLDFVNGHEKYGEDIQATADRRGYDMSTPEGRDKAAKEWFAGVVESGKIQPNLWTRFVVAFKNALRKMGFTSERLVGFSDSDIAEIIRGSIRAVEGKTQPKRISFGSPAMDYKDVFHGTPHVWPPEPGFPHGRPRLDKIGTGGGAAAYGWGWYSASVPETAKSYRDASRWDFLKTQPNNPITQVATMLEAGIPESEVRDGMIDLGIQKEDHDTIIREAQNLVEGMGSLYKLDIPDPVIPRFLDWDKPLSEQSEYVKSKIAGIQWDQELLANVPGMSPPYSGPYAKRKIDSVDGRGLYAALARKMGGQKAASEYLSSIGIPGNKYLDQMSRPVSETQKARIEKFKLDIERLKQKIENPPDWSRDQVGIVDGWKQQLREIEASLKKAESGAGITHNYVLWDQKVLDQIALLERNGEKLDAIREQETQMDYSMGGKKAGGVTETPEFKKWASDIEKANLFSDMRYARGSDRARDMASQFIDEPLKNLDSGIVATVSGASLSKMLSESAYGRSISPQAHMQAVANLDKLFQASAIRLSRDDRKGDENIKGLHHFEVPMKFDDEILNVKIMAKEFVRKERGTRLYLVQAIEIGKPASYGEGLTSTQEMSSPVAAPPAGFNEKIAHLMEIVKGQISEIDYSDTITGKDAPIHDYLKAREAAATKGSTKWKEPASDISQMDMIFKQMLYYAPKVPALKKMYDAAGRYLESKTGKQREILYAPDGKTAYPKELERIEKEHKEQFETLGKYLVTLDMAAKGYKVKQKDEHTEGGGVRKTFILVAPKEDWKEGTFSTEKEAWKAAIEYEAEAYAKFHKGAHPDIIKALTMFRSIGHNMYDMLHQSMEAMIEEYEKAGKPLPEFSFDDASTGKKVRMTLKKAMAEMGDIRGSYFPRTRKPGAFTLIAKKEDANPILEKFDIALTYKNEDSWQSKIPLPINIRAAALRKQGYDVTMIKSDALPESVFLELSGQSIALESLLTHAFDQLNANQEHSLKDMGIKSKWDGNDFLIYGEGIHAKSHPAILQHLGGEYKYVQKKGEEGYPSIRFKDAKDDIAEQVKDTLLKHAQSTFVDTMFGNSIITTLADIFKARGGRSGMVARHKGVGVEVWKGYEEDPIIAFTRASLGIAGATAKGELAKQLHGIITGRTESWAEYQQRIVDTTPATQASYAEYQKEVEARKISATKQPNAYKLAQSYTQSLLRNDESVDRIVGVAGGLAVLKYLWGRPGAVFVNLTNMAAGVPGSMKGHAGIPINKTFGLIGKAGLAYKNFKFGDGKSLDKWTLSALEHIEKSGWDQAQYNQEAMAPLEGKFGRAFERVMELGMLGFSVSEKINRVSTTLGTYMGIKEMHKGPWNQVAHEAALEKAKEVSDKAHGVYGDVNRPYLAQGGGVAGNMAKSFFMFKTFSHNYVLNMIELGFKKEIKAMSYLALAPAIMAGASASVLAPLVMAACKAFGVDDPEEEFYAWMEKEMGSGSSIYARTGLLGMGGNGPALKGSLSIGITDLPTSISDILGAPAGIVKDLADSAKAIGRGDLVKGVEKALPNSLAGPIRAYRESTEGMTTSSNAPRFFGDQQVKLTGYEAAMRAFSFNPSRIAVIQDIQRGEYKAKEMLAKQRAEIYARARRAILTQNQDEYADVLARMNQYNMAVKGNDRYEGYPLLTWKKILLNVRKSQKPSKLERNRQVEF